MANFKGDLFNYNGSAKIISAEASELYGFYTESVFGITSHRTGRTIHFCHKSTERDREGDVTHWVYEPLGTDAEVQGWRVHIYND